MTGTSSKHKHDPAADAQSPRQPGPHETPPAEPNRGHGGSSAADTAVLEEKIAELERRLEEERQHALRSQAELENYRKRMQREMADDRRYAVVPLVRDLLPVVDNLQRSIEAAEKTGGSEELLAGVWMVVNQFEQILAQHQCVRIEAVGQPFDPNYHEAVAQEPSDEYAAGTVSRQMQIGYKLYDRVIRPTQVFVSTGPAGP